MPLEQMARVSKLRALGSISLNMIQTQLKKLGTHSGNSCTLKHGSAFLASFWTSWKNIHIQEGAKQNFLTMEYSLDESCLKNDGGTTIINMRCVPKSLSPALIC